MSATWTAVTEQTPEPGKAVLIALQPGTSSVPVWVGWYEEALSSWVDSDGYPVRVTHWDELPAGPQA